MKRSQLEGHVVLPPDFPLPLDRPFTYRAAQREAGLDSNDLHWLVSKGFLRRPLKSVYVAAQVPDSVSLRCACLRLVVPPDAVICDRHAGWLHGAEMVLAPGEHLALAPIRIFLPGGEGRRLRNDLADSGERTLLREDIVEIDGLRVTSPIRTAWDLGRHRWPDRSLSALDQMLRLGLFDKEELVSGVKRFRGMRWVTVLRATVVLADPRAESPPESVLRLRWIEVLVFEPMPQLEVWEGADFLARLDIGNEEWRYAAEYDGAEWHSTDEQLEHDRARRALCEERAGYLITPIRKENLFGRNRDAERLLRADAEEARRRFGVRLP